MMTRLKKVARYVRCVLGAALVSAGVALAGDAPVSRGVEARVVDLSGTLTNTTAEAAAPARLVLAIIGDTVTATLKTEPPLVGSGTLAGRIQGGWCELAGKLDQGFQLQLRGAMNGRDFRGTYLAVVDGSPLQYGKFQLAVAVSQTRR